MVASTHPYDGRRNVVQGQTGNVTSSPRLGGLVVKAGIVNLVGDDRTLIYGALLWTADKATRANTRGRSGPRRGSVRSGMERRGSKCLAGAERSGVTDGGQREDLKNRSAARHRAAPPRQAKEAERNGQEGRAADRQT